MKVIKLFLSGLSVSLFFLIYTSCTEDIGTLSENRDVRIMFKKEISKISAIDTTLTIVSIHGLGNDSALYIDKQTNIVSLPLLQKPDSCSFVFNFLSNYITMHDTNEIAVRDTFQVKGKDTIKIHAGETMIVALTHIINDTISDTIKFNYTTQLTFVSRSDGFNTQFTLRGTPPICTFHKIDSVVLITTDIDATVERNLDMYIKIDTTIHYLTSKLSKFQ